MEVIYPAEEEIELDFEADLRAQDAWRESQLMQETGGLGSMARGILRPGGRHTIVCRHWLRDLCMKGDKCDFLHQYDLARMPECVQWARFGKCPDNDCDFRHDTEKMECQKYKFGFCKLGSQCRMRHDKLPRAYLPESAPDWYLKEIIPNFFDFVPKLPEEAVRVSGADEAPPAHPPPIALVQPPTGPWNVPVPQPVHGTDQNWAAPAVTAWNVRPSTQKSSTANWSSQKVVDLTEGKAPQAERRKGDGGGRSGPSSLKVPADKTRDQRADDRRGTPRETGVQSRSRGEQDRAEDSKDQNKSSRFEERRAEESRRTDQSRRPEGRESRDHEASRRFEEREGRLPDTSRRREDRETRAPASSRYDDNRESRSERERRPEPSRRYDDRDVSRRDRSRDRRRSRSNDRSYRR